MSDCTCPYDGPEDQTLPHESGCPKADPRDEQIATLTRKLAAEAARKDAALKRASDAEAARVVDWNARRAAEADAASLRERLARLADGWMATDAAMHWPVEEFAKAVRALSLKCLWCEQTPPPPHDCPYVTTPQQPAAGCLACAKVSRSSDPGLSCAIHGTRAPGAPAAKGEADVR